MGLLLGPLYYRTLLQIPSRPLLEEPVKEGPQNRILIIRAPIFKP